MSVVVIGVDPGESSGVALLRDGELVSVFQGDAANAMTLVRLLSQRFARTDGDDADHDVTIAYERFVSMQTRGRGRSHQPVAQRLAGALENISQEFHHRIVAQGPADAHAVAPIETLKKLGMYQTGNTVGQPDANDANMAIRHALLYLMRAHTTLFGTVMAKHGVLS